MSKILRSKEVYVIVTTDGEQICTGECIYKPIRNLKSNTCIKVFQTRKAAERYAKENAAEWYYDKERGGYFTREISVKVLSVIEELKII